MTPFETLQSLRPLYPTPMSAVELGSLLNEVAWTHRNEGWGLISKSSGANCPQPVTGTLISKDILMHYPSTHIYDCLIDSDGAATPTWQDKGPFDVARFVLSVDAGTHPSPGPTPPPSGGSIPYNEAYAIEFGLACNDVYTQSGAAFDPGMIAVHASRAAWDFYVGGLSWPASKQKHINEFRSVYNLPPI